METIFQGHTKIAPPILCKITKLTSDTGKQPLIVSFSGELS